MSKEQEIERARVVIRDTLAESPFGSRETLTATALYDAGLLLTDEARACVEACEAYAQAWERPGSTETFRECLAAGRASLAAKEPRPRYVVKGATVIDTHGCKTVSTFCNPDAESRARADCAALNGGGR